MATTSERIQKLRKEFQLSQSQLARKINVSIDTVSAWERGLKIPTKDRLERLSKFFFVNKDYILGNSDKRLLDGSITRDTARSDFSTDKEFLADITMYLNTLNKDSLMVVYDLVRSLHYGELEEENSEK